MWFLFPGKTLDQHLEDIDGSGDSQHQHAGDYGVPAQGQDVPRFGVGEVVDDVAGTQHEKAHYNEKDA